jgi:hypothetical protein
MSGAAEITYEDIVAAAVKTKPRFLAMAIEKKSDLSGNQTNLTKILAANGAALEHIAEENQTTALVLTALESNPDAAQYIRPTLLMDVSAALISKSGLNLKYIPDLSNNEAYCLAAVQNHGAALEYVSPALKGSPSIVGAAVGLDASGVASTPLAVRFINTAAYIASPDGGQANLTSLYEGALKKWWWIIRYIPGEEIAKIDRQLLINIVSKHPDAVEFIPSNI